MFFENNYKDELDIGKMNEQKLTEVEDKREIINTKKIKL